MLNKLSKSIVITGASVSGKTTLYRCLVVYFGLLPLPLHLTRKIRKDEVDGVDGKYISEEEFKRRFQNGEYLQESVDSTFFSGSYSGCPKEWVKTTEKGDYNCFVCPTVVMAKKMKKLLGPKIFWIHLKANSRVRQQRLAKRDPDLPREYFETRIKRGDKPVDINGHDLLINTSYLGAGDIFFRTINNL